MVRGLSKSYLKAKQAAYYTSGRTFLKGGLPRVGRICPFAIATSSEKVQLTYTDKQISDVEFLVPPGSKGICDTRARLLPRLLELHAKVKC